MKPTRQYLLDTNVFIEAQTRYYSFNLCPGFWECLIAFHEDEKLFSIDRVKAELTPDGMEFKKWLKQVPKGFFVSTDRAEIIKLYAAINQWVYSESFKESAKLDFMSGADPWLAACAKVGNFVLITHERREEKSKKKVPLPNVCDAFKVETIDTFKMLEELGARFTWER